MPTLTMTDARATGSASAHSASAAIRPRRVESIDLLRGTVMIIMCLDHVRDYFHGSAYLYDPTDLSRTSAPIFFTRWITHYCAPIFVFLAGISAQLYGAKRSRPELSFFLLTRGIWLVLAECLIVTLGWTFNPLYSIIIIQVIWAIGISMIVMSAMIWLDKRLILITGILLIFAHNLLDSVHVPGNGAPSLLWALVHDRSAFVYGHFTILIGYPILPWLGIMATGYCFGRWYTPGYDPEKRKKALLSLGLGAIALFILLRAGNFYGESAHWSTQKNALFSLLSFLRTSKYPPSLLYILMTLGPALVFLALAEKPLNALTSKIAVFGRVPMFFYLAHIFLVHALAVGAAVLSGHKWTDMVLTTWVSDQPELKGYGYSLLTVYIVWIVVIIILYPFCKRFDKYKRAHQAEQKWLSYF
ncbi:MAG TPA: heparan-alpha-glucosaminide N-acetyltransferase domain-containing protein [Puia sp.]|nr:heparan-alpha-glucosaminide N-acetyltransferase domain-containing protein [Puia sp.]